MGDTGSAAVSANEDPPVACAAAAETPEYTRPPTSPNLFSILPHHPSPILPPSSPHPPPILPPSSPIRLPERVVTEASREVVESHGKAWTGEGAEQCMGRLPIEGARVTFLPPSFLHPSPILPPHPSPIPPPRISPHSPSPHPPCVPSLPPPSPHPLSRESGHGGIKASGGGAWQGVDGGGRGAVRGEIAHRGGEGDPPSL
ncbi:unnamed protein product, partial [Closterium sp. Naga37s-1]